MSSQSERDYVSAVQDIVLEKKLVAALKRRSLASVLPFDPDLPYTDTNVSITSSSNDAASINSLDLSSPRSLSSTRSASLNIPSANSIPPKTPPHESVPSPVDQDSTQQSLDTLDIPVCPLDDTNSADLFFDAPDTDIVIESSNSALWVPADFHPEIDPEMFKAHVKLTVDEIMLRNLKRKSMLSCDSTSSSPCLETSHSRSSSLSPAKSSSAPSPEKDFLPSSSKRQSVSISRYSNPSIRELSDELEILSQRAGMGANDTVTLARTLSRSSLGYTDVELLAMDELQSPPSQSPHQQMYMDDIDSQSIPGTPVNSESSSRYNAQYHTQNTHGNHRNPRNSMQSTFLGFVSPPDGSESSQAFALRRSRRPIYRKASPSLGSTLQSTKHGKLAELRNELTHSDRLGASSPLPQRRRDKSARNSQYMFSYREIRDHPANDEGRNHSSQDAMRQETSHGASSDKSPFRIHGQYSHDDSRGMHGRPPHNDPNHIHGLPHQNDYNNRSHRNDMRNHPSRGNFSGPYSMVSMSSPSLVSSTPRHEPGTPRSRLSNAINTFDHTGPHPESNPPNLRHPSHGKDLSGMSMHMYHSSSAQAQPGDYPANLYRTHVPQSPNMGGPQSNQSLPPRHGQLAPTDLNPQHGPGSKEEISKDSRLPRQNPIRTPTSSAPLPVLSGPVHIKRESQFESGQSHNLNQNLDLLRSEINDFKETLTKHDAPSVDRAPSGSTKPEGSPDAITDLSFDVSDPDVPCETSFEIQNYLDESDLDLGKAFVNQQVVVESMKLKILQNEESTEHEALAKAPGFVDSVGSTSPISSDLEFDPSQFTGNPNLVVVDPNSQEKSLDIFVQKRHHNDSLVALERKPSMESVHADSDAVSLETSPIKQRKRFGSMPNNLSKIYHDAAQAQPAKIVKKKSSWMWLKDRSVSLDENKLSAESLRPSSRLASSPAFSSSVTKPLGSATEPVGKAPRHKENMLSKFFRKKKAISDATSAADVVESRSFATTKPLLEKRSQSFTKQIKEKKSATLAQQSKEKSPETTAKPLKNKKSRLFGTKKTRDEQPLIKVLIDHNPSKQTQHGAPRVSPDEDKENLPSFSPNVIEVLRSSTKKSNSQIDLLLDNDQEPTVVAETVEKPENTIPRVVEPQPTIATIKSDDEDLVEGLIDAVPKEAPLSTLEVHDKLKKSIRRTSKANQPLEFTDSAFGFPLPPPSPSTLIMIDYRFPLHVERAIYRLSHLKLANPKRSLREQVLLSNFMYAYLNLVDHTLHVEQQMGKSPDDTPENNQNPEIADDAPQLEDQLPYKDLLDKEFGEEGAADNEQEDDDEQEQEINDNVTRCAYKGTLTAKSGPASYV